VATKPRLEIRFMGRAPHPVNAHPNAHRPAPFSLFAGRGEPLLAEPAHGFAGFVGSSVVRRNVAGLAFLGRPAFDQLGSRVTGW
jgi:hypothetical protein